MAYSIQSGIVWQSRPRQAPEYPEEWRKFRHYLDHSLKMTPQGRTDLNNTLRHYEQLIKMDAKTQDRYEGEISTLQRQINDLTAKLKLAEGVIQKGQDEEEETPLPLLHMMERTAQAEKLYEDLRRDIIGAVIDCPDYTAIASVAHKVWQTTCPPENEQKEEADVALAILEDVINTEDLTTQDTLQELLDEKDDDCEAKLEDCAEEAREYLIGDVEDRIEGTFHKLMNKTAPFSFSGDWEDQLEDVRMRMEHYILTAETEQNNCQIAEEALAIVKDENEVNKKNLSQFIADKHALKGQLEQAEVKCRGLEKVIEDTTGWGDFVADLDEQHIKTLRSAGYPEEDLGAEEDPVCEQCGKTEAECDWEGDGPALSTYAVNGKLWCPDCIYDDCNEDEESEESSEEEGEERPALTFFQDLKKVPKMAKFMNQGGHIKMERADMTGNTKWMDECAKRGYLEAMKTHRKMTGSCFSWDCFDEWVKDK